MTDYIKREDALNASKLVYIECIEKDDGGFLEVDADNIPIVLKRDIMELPAADVIERKRGHWGAYDFHTVECSACEFRIDIMKIDSHVLTHLNFCPNCGADMRGDSDV